jgi:mono/diheme cytochrome c family protein
MKVVAGSILSLIVLALAAAGYLYAGFYNVAAVEPHASLTRWALTTAMQRSVKVQARSITPPSMPQGQKIDEAFRAFDEMCVVCHGAPGKEPGVIGKGLQPPPPTLSEAAHRWSRAELFWIVKNGVRMTGMPAFGPTHSDDNLWLLVAFLQRLPNVSSSQYKKMEEQYKGKGKEPSGAPSGQEHKH